MNKKKAILTRTVDTIKKERRVPDHVKEELKKFNRMKREIRKALEEGPLTIPELAEKLELEKAEVTFHVMTLRKYGLIVAGEIDDMDEFYYYQLKK
jgi:DNA-binding transcriptional ArsR family regulator